MCSDKEVLKRPGVFHSDFYLFVGAMSFQFEHKAGPKSVRLCESLHQGSAMPEWEYHNFPGGHSFKEEGKQETFKS